MTQTSDQQAGKPQGMGVAAAAATLLPGLAVSAAIAWLGILGADWIGKGLLGLPQSPVSGIMMAIVLGMVVGNVLRLPRWLDPGVQCALKKVLRLGIILLGIRLGVGDALRLGALGVPVILGCIAGGVALTGLLGRLLRLPARLSALIAVGTAICGASAIVATGPAIEAQEEEIAYAVGCITLFGLLAMLGYPYLAHALLREAPVAAGVFLGTAIHETAQVAGAALIHQQLFGLPEALDAAVVAKLVRNVCMILVIPAVAWGYRRRQAARAMPNGAASTAGLFPLFILGFVALVIVRSLGDALVAHGGATALLDPARWVAWTATLEAWAGRLLAVAMAAVGLGTRMSKLKGLGLRPLYAGLGAALAVGLLSLAGLQVLGWMGLY